MRKRGAVSRTEWCRHKKDREVDKEGDKDREREMAGGQGAAQRDGKKGG